MKIKPNWWLELKGDENCSNCKNLNYCLSIESHHNEDFKNVYQDRICGNYQRGEQKEIQLTFNFWEVE